MESIKVLCPSWDEETKNDLIKALDNGWWGQGGKTKELEEKWAEFTGFKYAIATSSCTAALDLCFKAYEITSGECIVPPMTFVADVSEPERNGMDVTFADIDEKTLCINPDSVIITPQTQAIIAVNSHGRIADIEGLRKNFDGLIIEDCAHCGGMTREDGIGKGDIQVWSFQAVKTLPAGDGGMITTNDEDIARKIRSMTWLGVEKNTYERNQGKKYSWDYDIVRMGTKSYMNDINATLVLGQLRRVDEILSKRQKIQTKYNNALKGLVELPEWSKTCQYYTIKVDNRDKLGNYLAECGVTTSVHFKPLSEMTYWKKAIKRELHTTNKVWKRLLSLPCHDALTDDEQDYIIDRVKEFILGIPSP